jgi:hypothetical protein
MAPPRKYFYGFGSFNFATGAVGTSQETSGFVIFNNKLPLHITNIILSLYGPQALATNTQSIFQRMLLVDGSTPELDRINDPLPDFDSLIVGTKLADYRAYFGSTQHELGHHQFYFGERGLVILSPCTLIITPAYQIVTGGGIGPQGQFLSPCYTTISTIGFEEQDKDTPPYHLR